MNDSVAWVRDNWRGQTAGDNFDPGKDNWWNPAAFGVDANGNRLTATQILYAGFGNSARLNHKLRSPWNLNENLSVSKGVNFTESVKMTLRVEAFNIFNRVRWGDPNTTVNNNAFTLGNDPRRLQFAFKIVFCVGGGAWPRVWRPRRIGLLSGLGFNIASCKEAA